MTLPRRLFRRRTPSFRRLMTQNHSDPISDPAATVNGSLVTLRKASLTVCIIGAALSIILFLLASQQAPISIVFLFVGWLLAPFVVLLFAHVFANRWSALTQTALYWMTLLTTVVSVAIYAYQFIWPRQSTPAFYWVAVPPASTLLAIAVISIAGIISRRSPDVR